MLFVLIPILAILALSWLPQLYVDGVMRANARHRDDINATGAQFARYLLDKHGLSQVRVEETKSGDHYDPQARVVRIASERYRQRSLAAVVIAAHEVGHAIQHQQRYEPLMRRTRLAKQAAGIEKVGGIVMLASPLMLLITKSPLIMAIDYLAGAVIMGLTVITHLTTLPVEFDASFKRALPLLKGEGGLQPADIPAARRLLRAAALTYVAGAAMSLLNVSRWIRVLWR